MRKLLLALLLLPSMALAQSCGPYNPGCLVPTPSPSDISNRATPTNWIGTATGIVGGDLTGPLSTSLVSKIQGNPVLGTTGTGNVVFSNSPTFTGTMTAVNETISGSLAVTPASCNGN